MPKLYTNQDIQVCAKHSSQDDDALPEMPKDQMKWLNLLGFL